MNNTIGNIDPEDDEEPRLETHVRAKEDLDPKIIQHLEKELIRAMNQGNTVIDPLFNAGLPDASVSMTATSSTFTSLYANSNSISMESFTLDTFTTSVADGRLKSDYDSTDFKCCGSSKTVQKTESDVTLDQSQNTSFLGNSQGMLLPPQSKDDKGKICLVLDLDETLVHSSFLAVPHCDYRFSITVDSGPVDIFVSVRPSAISFLKELGPLFEIVIFTASAKIYADAVIDFIDQSRVVKHRLYRESCTEFGGNFVKDLSRLNRPLEKVIIIDNSPAAYLLQPYNAISISSWFEEPTDSELPKILEFLKENYRCNNVYEIFGHE